MLSKCWSIRIRRRLQEAGADMHIHTLRGVGYVLSDKVSQ